MSVEIKYMPLSFINTDKEILKQIKNTVLFSYLFQEFEETSLIHYLESTQYGYTASASEIGTHQLVRITDINSGKVDWKTVPFCDCDAEAKYLLKDNDILIARTGGTTGKSFIVNSAPDNAIFASYLIRLRLKKDVNLEFINLYLNSYAFWSQIVEMKSGSAMPNVNAEKLKTLKIPKISFEEQNTFVSSFKNIEKSKNLNSLFEKINEVESLFINSKKTVTELTHQLDLIKQLRQAFLREAMQGKLVTAVRSSGVETQQTGQQLLAKIKAEKAQLIAEKKLKKEKPLPVISAEEIPFEIPEHWVWCRLGEICNYGSSPKSEPKDLNENTWVLDLEDIEKETSTLLNKIRFNERNSLSTKSIFKKGQVLYSKLRPYLDKVIVADEDGVCTTEILPLKLYGNLNPYFTKFALKRSDFLIYVNSVTKGMKMPRLGTNDGQMALFPLPPLHEQEQIVTKLEELMAFCDGLEQSIKESQGYNEMLLQQVLREALQPKEETKIITIATRKLPNPLKTILAAHIVNICNTRDFGRVKFQKLLFLVEYFCKIDFESKYVKKAAGPYDYQLIKQIEQDFNRMNFFKVEQDKSDNHRVTYTPRSASSEINGFFLENFSDESLKINAFLMKMRPLSWSECEIVATIFAVWNNRLIKKELVTDELLFNDFMAWSSRKSDLAKDFYKKLFWMKEEKIIPEGWGNYVEEPSL
ncbi:restriction endonuclease subunit S [Flavobacterium muglaense]|uniref:Restriction endonuclease subunit S n=1 Tax=Flavobacterium muglaense TaxID=2764716 RepID=A0A923MZA2_9FLAO|nr:restriction endonuclease subunit S [Flavobacterium muglaense]MBC5837808.1 restriction endonuclease subunit S [Flavobacterium muglaense]MBC5844434.1 restriction endonuclease subunit S [Flavobacterium muglaense]